MEISKMPALSYLAILTADSLRWTATTGAQRTFETVKAYDDIPCAGFGFTDFRHAVMLAASTLYGIPIRGTITPRRRAA